VVAAFDTGSTGIVVSPELYAFLFNDTELEQDCSNYASMPNVTLTLDSTDYVLTPEDYVIIASMGTMQACMNGIMPGLPPKTPLLIVGDTFFNLYYAHFDMNNDRIGFAKHA